MDSATTSGFVGGVVEELDLEAVARIVEAAAGVDEAVDDELLVVDGELDGDEGELSSAKRAGGSLEWAALRLLR